MKLRFVTTITLVLCIAACSKKEYDLSDGLNKEMTLFGEEISIPIGSIGPLTLEYAMGSIGKIEGLGSIVAEYIKEDPDGTLYLEDKGDIYRNNIYEIEKEMGDVSENRTWSAGDQSGYVGGMVGMLGFINIMPCSQSLTISASNPLRVDVPASCSAAVGCSGASGSTSIPLDALNNVTLKKRTTEEIFSLSFPDDVSSTVSSITLSNLSLEMPANPTSKIADKTGDLFLAFSYYYKCGITVGEKFSFPLTNISTGQINLPLSKYELKKCEVELELENTIPMSVTIDNVRVLKPRESKSDEAVVDENITITSGITVAGGSPQKPATTNIKLTVEAASGVIPDIPELLLDLKLNAQPDLGIVPLSTKQGVYVKSSSAKLSGGITIGRNE